MLYEVITPTVVQTITDHQVIHVQPLPIRTTEVPQVATHQVRIVIT